MRRVPQAMKQVAVSGSEEGDRESPLETPEAMQLCQQVILAQGDRWPIELRR